MSENVPKEPPGADLDVTLPSLALERLEQLEATDLASSALTKADIGKLADELLALLDTQPGT